MKTIRSHIHLSFIQLSELEQRGVNKIGEIFKRQREDSNPGSLDWESSVLTTTPVCPTITSNCVSGHSCKNWEVGEKVTWN